MAEAEDKNTALVKTLAQVPSTDVLGIIFYANLARPSNFDILGKEDWELLAVEVKKDYEFLTIEQLKEIIMLGVKGKLDKEDSYSNYSINFKTIYMWIDIWLKRNGKSKLSFRF